LGKKILAPSMQKNNFYRNVSLAKNIFNYKNVSKLRKSKTGKSVLKTEKIKKWKKYKLGWGGGAFRLAEFLSYLLHTAVNKTCLNRFYDFGRQLVVVDLLLL
jgi:hypothetical protein